MDGNRRWAKAHRLETARGHHKGAEKFGNVCDMCLDAGVPWLTVYALSTENLNREAREVSQLFSLMEEFFRKETATAKQKGIRLKIIGDRARIPAKSLPTVEEAEAATAQGKNLTVQIALAYGGRDEIVRAANRLASAGIKNITEDVFASFLDTAGIPDIDLCIRTGGAENRRTSNFLPWQTAYAEWYFSDLLWPDFSQSEFDKALQFYATANRKLGR
jgi:undecaprenyl diphosphate synthase